MKKSSFFLTIAFCLQYFAHAQQVASSALKAGYSVTELTKTAWNTPDGFPYQQVAGANLGVTSFEIIDNNRIAFLSDASNEILVIYKSTGKTNVKFSVPQAPRDFVYDQGLFYVLGDGMVSIYDLTGKAVSSTTLPESLVGVGRITRYNNATYLLLPSGNSVLLGASALQGFKGWMTGSGNFIYTAILNSNSYAVQVTNADGKVFNANFNSDKKVAGVYVVGSTIDRIMLDVQTYVTESPISVERHLITISLSPVGIGAVVSDKKIPDLYYVLSDKELSVLPNGAVLNMVSAPDGVHLFTLTETEMTKTNDYPSAILATKYHFNDHLIQLNESK